MRDKSLFKATLPYLRYRYHEDMLNRKKHEQFLLLAEEWDKKKTNYRVVRKIPKRHLKEAERLHLPKLADWIFLAVLTAVMTLVNIYLQKQYFSFFAVFGIGGVAYGIIIAITSNMDTEPPLSRSLLKIWERGNLKQSIANVLNTLGLWWMVAGSLYGITGIIAVGAPIQGSHGTMAAVGLIFALIFYKTRWS